MRRSGFRLFISSIIPGCGQMYQGYMKRGLSLLIEFFGILAVAVMVNVGQLAIFSLIVWLYAFFDSYNLRARIEEGVEKNPDAYILGEWIGNPGSVFGKQVKLGRIIGWALILVGVLILYNMSGWYLSSILSGWGYNILYAYLPRALISALLIGLGVWFIRGDRKKKGKTEEDFAAYVPQEEKGDCTDGEDDQLQGSEHSSESDCGEK